MSAVSNYTYDEAIYQRRAADGFIFHNQRTGGDKLKRLLLFDTKYQKLNKIYNETHVLNAISDYYGGAVNTSRLTGNSDPGDGSKVCDKKDGLT